jgi:hypothetical protein
MKSWSELHRPRTIMCMLLITALAILEFTPPLSALARAARSHCVTFIQPELVRDR